MPEINQKIWNYLKGSYEKNKLSHAYIFCGPTGTGKFDTLKNFFKLVNSEDFRFANQNIIIIESENEKKKDKERKKNISAEQVREAIRKASYFAQVGKKKFLIIKDADKLGDSAGNSLLKIIEEPKSDTIIFILCEKEDRILSTIRSRCQKIYFNLVSSEEIKKHLTNKFADSDKEKIWLSSIYSRGKYKLAEKLLTDEHLLEKKKEIFDIFKKAIKSNWFEALEAADKLSKNRDELLDITDEWIWSLGEFLRENIKNKPNRKLEQKILVMIKDLLELKEKIQNSNANEKIQLENFFIKTI